MAVLSRLRGRLSSFHSRRQNDKLDQAIATDEAHKSAASSSHLHPVSAERSTPNGAGSDKQSLPLADDPNNPLEPANGKFRVSKTRNLPSSLAAKNASPTHKGVREAAAPEASATYFEERLYNPAERSLSDPKTDLTRWFPPVEAYEKGVLRVSDLHELYWEWSGNPHGTPAVIIHGGPGGGCSPDDRRWFDPTHYRTLCLDQRGAGRSTPHGEIRENTTPLLVADLEFVRKHFNIDRWTVFGHSWGSTLALAYAEAHPTSVFALVLAGIFTARPSEEAFLLRGKGTAHIFPELWDSFESYIPPEERSNIIEAYYVRLNSPDHKIRADAAWHWTTYEDGICNIYVDPHVVQRRPALANEHQISLARIEAHYFREGCFLAPGQLLAPNELDKIRHIPASIVQGRYDLICPPDTAWQLHRLWPEASFTLVPDAGHATAHPGMISALVKSTELFKGLAAPVKSFSARSRGPSSHAHALAATQRSGFAPKAEEDASPRNDRTPSELNVADTGRQTPLAGSDASSLRRTSVVRHSPLRVTGNAAFRRASMRYDLAPRSAPPLSGSSTPAHSRQVDKRLSQARSAL